MISRDVYLKPVLDNAPRLLGLLNRNISSSSYGSFDREYWHYNTVDFSCARKQEAVLTLTLLYTIEHEQNGYYRSREILEYIRAALLFWTKIQNSNGSFNEWYPSEHSFVVTSFSTYAVSESLLLIREALPENDYKAVMRSLEKAGEWLLRRHEMRVMNQQTGAAVALLNLYLLTDNRAYLSASRDKIALLDERQSDEGWFLEYGGPDIGYLSLAIDYLCKYYRKTQDGTVGKIIERSLQFIKYFVQPNLVAGGEYTSRNTEYLIPHGFEVFSRLNDDARLTAAVVRKSLLKTDSFPDLFDDRYLTYVGYTWLQAFMDANPDLDNSADETADSHFHKPFRMYFQEAGMLIINDGERHLILNVKKGGAFRLYDKKDRRVYSDSGMLVHSDGVWYTSGWLAEAEGRVDEGSVAVSGHMWKVPDKTLTPFSNILLRLFQMTLGRSAYISLWIKERLRDLLITKTRPSRIRYNRNISFPAKPGALMTIRDSATAEQKSISRVSVFAKDTHIYVPSSRYYVNMKEPPFLQEVSPPVSKIAVEWEIGGNAEVQFRVTT